MLHLILLVALTQQQMADAERFMYQKLQMDEAAIFDIWKPSKHLLSDFRHAESCYVKFHLGKERSCKTQLDKLDREIESVTERVTNHE